MTNAIQIGPLEIPSVTQVTDTVQTTGAFRKLQGTVPQQTQPGTKKLKLKVRLKKDDPVYHQLIELMRNNKIGALPLYSGYNHVDALHVVTSMREKPINWLWQEIDLTLEDVGNYFMKTQDSALRKDDWNTIYQEDFEDWSGSQVILNETLWGALNAVTYEGTVTDVGSGTFPVGEQCGVIGQAGETEDRKSFLFGFDYWKNYSFSAWVQSSSSENTGLIWRAESGNFRGVADDYDTTYDGAKTGGKHYRIVIDYNNNQYRVEYHNGWEASAEDIRILYSESHDELNIDTWYLLQVITIGDYHFCYVNGAMITYFKDKNCKGGRCGLYYMATGDTQMWMDNILVQEVPAAVLTLDESYSSPQGEIAKTRQTLYGQIAYAEDQAIKYKSGSGGPNCILYLRMDQEYGEMVADHSIRGNHARVRGGEWRDGYIRFSAKTDGLVVPYDEIWADSGEQGTIIMRMRVHDRPVLGGGDSIVIRGEDDWSIFWRTIFGHDHMKFAQGDPSSAAAFVAPRTTHYPIEPDAEWRTFVFRWDHTKTANGRWEIYVDGMAAGSDYDEVQKNYWDVGPGPSTEDMFIGQANVDIAYLVIYNTWMEEPSIPGSISSNLLDVDEHHEDEVWDLRCVDHPDRLKEYWSATAPTVAGGAPVYQDYGNPSDQKALLYRRSGYHFELSDHVTFTLPDELKNRLHKMDWTLEMVFVCSSGTTKSDHDMLVIGNSDRSTKTIKISTKTNSNPEGFFWATIDQSAGTKYVNFYDTNSPWPRGGAIIHLTHRATTNEMKYYWYGEYQGKEVLADDLGLLTDTVHLGTTGGGNNSVNYYRIRIIAKNLSDKEIERMTKVYGRKPVQVFDEHEFKGYPELNNGLMNVRTITENADKTHGDKLFVELFNDGSFIPVINRTGDAALVHNAVLDDEGDNTGHNTHYFRLLNAQPVVKHISNDEVIIETRGQSTMIDQLIPVSGVHVRTQVGLSAGLFAMDLNPIVTTRTSAWQMEFNNLEVQALWREGSHHPEGQTSENDVFGDFMTTSGLAIGQTMPSFASYPHLRNFSVGLNLNWDRSTWDNINYILGVMPEHTNSYMRAAFSNGSDIFDTLALNGLAGFRGEYRVAVAIVPYDNTKVFEDVTADSPFSWSISNLNEVVHTEYFNGKYTRSDGTSNEAVANVSKTFDPGTWISWWTITGSMTVPILQIALYDSENYIIRKQTAYGLTWPTKGSDHLYKDLSFVINDDDAKTLTTEISIRGADNAVDEIIFDGVIFIPCYNGVDWILDQLFSARAVKNVRRYPR